jgi:acyl-coenzyme A thioesterase PaaI-like protein
MTARSPLAEAAHALALEVRVSDAPSGVAAVAIARIDEARSILAPHRHGGPYAVEQLRPPSEEFRFDPADPAACVPFAPISGRRNPTSADVALRVVAGTIEGEVTFPALQAGPMNLVHGGALAGLCDELLALAVLAHGAIGFTREMSIEFRAPARLGQPLAVRAFVARGDERSLLVQAQVLDDGRLAVQASGSFRRIGDLSGSFYDKPGARLAEHGS